LFQDGLATTVTCLLWCGAKSLSRRPEGLKQTALTLIALTTTWRALVQASVIRADNVGRQYRPAMKACTCHWSLTVADQVVRSSTSTIRMSPTDTEAQSECDLHVVWTDEDC